MTHTTEIRLDCGIAYAYHKTDDNICATEYRTLAQPVTWDESDPWSDPFGTRPWTGERHYLASRYHGNARKRAQTREDAHRHEIAAHFHKTALIAIMDGDHRAELTADAVAMSKRAR